MATFSSVLVPYGISAKVGFALGDGGNTLGATNYIPQAGDCRISKDTGSGFNSPANTANLPTGFNTPHGPWYLELTAAELTCRQAVITINDPEVVINTHCINIYTFGNPAAMYAIDLNQTVPTLATITLAPVQTMVVGDITQPEHIQVFNNTTLPAYTWIVTDSRGVAIDLTGSTVVLTVYRRDGSTLFSLTSANSGLTIANTNYVTEHRGALDVAVPGIYDYVLMRTVGGAQALAWGTFEIL